MDVLPPDFYARSVLDVAPDLIGCTVTHGGVSGVIVETEAYHETEPACHAFAGLTARTETLFGPPGTAYVYRSYGVHALLNAVCEREGVGAAVLIRALEPLKGIEQMRARRALAGRPRADSNGGVRVHDLCSGPGKLTQALGIWLSENGTSLSRGPIRISARSAAWREPQIVRSPRVGITHAADVCWRFSAAGNANVSRPRPALVWQRRSARLAAHPREDLARAREDGAVGELERR
jgi:DNA-3-methyladenine glycosylase